jgi:hypothetical protein
MENSRRNIIIIVGAIIIVCGCITLISLGLLGYLFPIERVVTFFSTNEPVAVVPEEMIVTPEETLIEPTPTESVILPSPTIMPTEASPTDAPPEPPTPEPIPPEIAVQMDQIETEVITLRNLQPTGPVSRRLLSPDDLRQKIESDFFEDYPIEEAEQDTIVLSAIGLLDPDFDMFNFYQDLLSEQIAGQYDQNTKEMDIIQDSGFGGIERLTYAHEYTHALQDQNYDIENGLNYSSESCKEDSERCAAIQALLEGDASMLELEWFNNYATSQDFYDIQDFYQDYEGPVLESAPDFLREDFIFPYIYGQSFVEYLYNIGGWDAINNAYRDLPLSTEQILHPERYPDDRPIEIEKPDLSLVLGDQWQELDSGVMGEWYTYLILAHGREPDARIDDVEAQNASEGWGGDYYLVYYDEQNQDTVVVMRTIWESENDAKQFFDAFQQHSSARFGSPSNDEGNRINWTHPEGFTEISIDELETTWIFAPDEATALLVNSAIP